MIVLLIPFRPWVLALMVAVMGLVVGSLLTVHTQTPHFAPAND